MLAARAALVLASLGCTRGLGPSASGKRYIVLPQGQLLVREMARNVLDNRQEVLKVPWIISRTRDIGYVGEFPVSSEFMPIWKEESLQTTREAMGYNPWVAVGTWELPNGQPAAPMSKHRMGKVVAGESVKHLNGVVSPGAELTVWQYQRSKMHAFDAWISGWIQRNPDKLVVVHSHGDMLYGGCSENELTYKYEEVLKANKHSGYSPYIVMAAEVSPYPEDLGWYYSKAMNSNWTESRRAAALSYFGLAEDWASTYANCSNTTNSRCNSPPKYKFVNSGFYMGPAWALREMMLEIAAYDDSENRFLNEYFLRNPSKVALDYSGYLALSLHSFVKSGRNGTTIPGPVEIRNGTDVSQVHGTYANQSIEVTVPTFKLFNKDTSTQVCFVHGNGNSFDTVKGLAETLLAYASEAD